MLSTLKRYQKVKKSLRLSPDILKVVLLIHFRPMFSFYIPWKHHGNIGQKWDKETGNFLNIVNQEDFQEKQNWKKKEKKLKPYSLLIFCIFYIELVDTRSNYSQLFFKIDIFKILRKKSIFRSSHLRCSVRKTVLWNFPKSQENICARVSFLIKLQACEFCEISKNTFFLT